MGKEASNDVSVAKATKYYTVEEIKQHNKRDDNWLMINGKVYDLSRWAKKHPGGAKILGHYAGEDATDAWTAFHNDKGYVSKFMKALYIGDVKDWDDCETDLKKDFRKLRKYAEDSGLMKTNPAFYILHLLHILALEALAYYVVWSWQGSMAAFIVAAVLLATAQ
ncbi:acyl-CoA Delta-6 desaturase-like, partial [Saccostrea cucullata]|uniref:acyl-CoA Delta-6 desaturase-like n=1 Tax=Saccostrea cuccullata TaxID=36930 RepID=UPI002ED6835C